MDKLDNVKQKKLLSNFEYEVALSFSGHDRKYAEQLASALIKKGVRVFYDKYERSFLWGKNLYQHLQSIYKDKALFCVIFLSKSYAANIWTKHELEQAQARAFEENREYILPVRLDQTKIPGISDTVGYINFDEMSINEIADLILQKLSSIEDYDIQYDFKALSQKVKLSIEDNAGDYVKFTREDTLLVLNKNIDSNIFGIAGDGKIIDIKVHPGKITKSRTEAGYYFIDCSFDRILKKGETVIRKYECIFLNSFNSNDEYFIIEQTYPCDKFELLVIFPDNRKFSNFSGVVRVGNQEKLCTIQPTETKEENHKSIKWSVPNPNFQDTYKLYWAW